MQLTLHDGIEIISKMQLIVPETFDTFVSTVLWWYKENAIEDVPNTYDLLNEDNPFTNSAYDSFIESYGYRMFDREPTDSEMDDLFSDVSEFYEPFYKDMIHDFELVLKEMRLHFIFSSYFWSDSEDDLRIENTALQEVW
jgi:hypothetical protein